MGHARLERVLLFGTRSADYIRASGHTGCIATEAILQATTGRIHDRTRRFADSQIPLAPRAPSIHDPSLPFHPQKCCDAPRCFSLNNELVWTRFET
jgi:hypothetical protein